VIIDNADTTTGDTAFAGVSSSVGSNLAWYGGFGAGYDGGAAIGHSLGNFAGRYGILDVSLYLGGSGGLSFATPQDIVFYSGGLGTGDISLHLESDGTASTDIVNYETLVTSDNDFPNKKYVDDLVGGLSPNYWQRNSTNISPATSGDNLIVDGTLTIGDDLESSVYLYFKSSGAIDANIRVNDSDVYFESGVNELMKLAPSSGEYFLGTPASSHIEVRQSNEYIDLVSKYLAIGDRRSSC